MHTQTTVFINFIYWISVSTLLTVHLSISSLARIGLHNIWVAFTIIYETDYKFAIDCIRNPNLFPIFLATATLC